MIIGILANDHKEQALVSASQVCKWLAEHNIAFAIPAHLAYLVDEQRGKVSDEDFGNDLGLCLVFGGDGTLLNAAQKLIPHQVPLLAVNVGGMLGFLTELSLEGLWDKLPAIVAGEFRVEKRLTLKATLYIDSKIINERTAVNDVVVSRGSIPRIMEAQIEVNGQPLVTFYGDGVIIATPTGSTAYSLSAGGPVLDPVVESIMVTPICPHTFSVRTVVLAPTDVLKLRVTSPIHQGIPASVDGARCFDMMPKETLVIERGKEHFLLARIGEPDFYTRLREKMGWGG
jgi:NAD+ kinase